MLIVRIISGFFLFILFAVGLYVCAPVIANDGVPEVNWDASEDSEQVYFPNKDYLEYRNRYSPKCGYDKYCPTSDKETDNDINTSERPSNRSDDRAIRQQVPVADGVLDFSHHQLDSSSTDDAGY